MNTEKDQITEEILNSLDGVKRVSPPDFFYTRLKAKMEKGPVAPILKRRVLYPAYVLSALFLVLLVNAAVVFTKNNSTGDNISATETETLQSIAAEYSPGDVSSLYDLNEER